jgi:hypothetical protein
VLVCCTGGEEGDLQNPAPARAGPTVPRPHARAGEGQAGRAPPARAAAFGRDHRLRPRRHARLPRFGHARQRGQCPSRVLRQRRPRRGGRPARRGDPGRAPAGDHHLRRRPARLPAPRPPEGARHLAAGLRTCGRPELVPRARRALAAVEDVLLDVEQGPDRRPPRGHDPPPRRVAVRPGVARPARPGPPHHHQARHRRLPVGAHRLAQGSRHPGRPHRAWWFGLDDHQLREVYPYEDWILARSLVGTPAEGELETDLFAGVRDLAISGGDE